jgi:hypothetical protein
VATQDIERDFPGMEYEVRSDEDFNYNCLAFALGDSTNWWEPGVMGHYWPPGFPADTTVKTVSAIIATHGFVVENADPTTVSTDSVAIFAEGDKWTHFAKFTNGEWSSKLGEDHDVTHVRLRDLEGASPKYGRLVKILSRGVGVE